MCGPCGRGIVRSGELSLFFFSFFYFILHRSGTEMLSWITLDGTGWKSDWGFFLVGYMSHVLQLEKLAKRWKVKIKK